MLIKGMRVVYDHPDSRKETGWFRRYVGDMSCEILTDRLSGRLPFCGYVLNVNKDFVKPEPTR